MGSGPYPEGIELWEVSLPLWDHLNIPCTQEICVTACLSDEVMLSCTCWAAMTRLH